jgi:hypothetical protein|tara:strand:- start:223 stop:504 length:282 start_codon:yes stop_codon:yes gene_type:complete
MDKEKGQGDVDTKFELLNFPEPPEEQQEVPTTYEVTVTFTTGKVITIFCSGFSPMEHFGKSIVGFYNGESSSNVHTILNCSKIDFMDIEEREV